MFGYDWPRLHAMVVSLPVALLSTAVLFELGSLVLKKPSLRQIGFALLMVGTLGAGAAVLLGLQAEDAIAHGNAIHRLMGEHEELAYYTLGIFAVVALWRLVRERKMGSGERLAVFLLSLVGFGFLVDTGHHGGRLVFEHAAGVPNAVLQAELIDRQEGHAHGAGQAHDDHAGAAGPGDADHTGPAPGDSGAGQGSTLPHTHPPGTPAHKD